MEEGAGAQLGHRVKRCLLEYAAVREPKKTSQYARKGARALAREVDVWNNGNEQRKKVN